MRPLDYPRDEAQAGTVTPRAYVSSIGDDAHRIAEIGALAMNEPVPSCPGWDLAALMTHVGWVYRWFTYLTEVPNGERGDPPQVWASRTHGSSSRPDEDVAVWFRNGVDDLVHAIEQGAPGKTINWIYGVHGLSVLARRAATEIAIHRHDAEGAVGAAAALHPTLAVDAVDEFLELLVPAFFKFEQFAGTGRTIRFESTDRDSCWVLTTNAETLEWRRSAEETVADCAARGCASDLYLFCWGRETSAPLEVRGDTELLRRWQAAATF